MIIYYSFCCTLIVFVYIKLIATLHSGLLVRLSDICSVFTVLGTLGQFYFKTEEKCTLFVE